MITDENIVPQWHRELLVDSTRGFIKAFDLNPDATFPMLDMIAMDYVVNLSERKRLGTRGHLLIELLELAARHDRKLASHLLFLSEPCIEALCGRAPLPSFRFEQDGSEALRVTNKGPVLVPAIKSAVARRKPADIWLEPSLFRGIPATKSTLIDFANSAPDEFRLHLKTTIDQLEAGYRVGAEPGGRNLSLLEGLEAPPEWRLIKDVVNLVWPMKKGRLHSSKMLALREIIYFTKLYALGTQKDENGKPIEILLNHDMISGIITLRYQIQTLKEVILFIHKRQTLLAENPDIRDRWKRFNRLDSFVRQPLAIWQGELERRLLFGDYRPWNIRIRRATGEAIGVPKMPILRKGMPMSGRALSLVWAAKSLRSTYRS